MSFVIWGYSTTTKSLPLGKQRCQSCGRLTHHEQVEADRQFELFFVPIFSLGRTTWVRCNACGFESAATGGETPAAPPGQAAPAASAPAPAGSSQGTRLLLLFLLIFFAVVALVLVASLLFGAVVVFGFLYMIFAPLIYMFLRAMRIG